MAEADVKAHALIAEYVDLKRQQRDRIRSREREAYGLLLTMGAVAVAAMLAHQPGLLLLVPAMALWFGQQHNHHSEWIRKAAEHVVDELVPRARDLDVDLTQAFSWDVAHRADPDRRERKLRQLAANLILFCVLPLSAVVVFACSTGEPTIAYVVGVVEAALVAWSSWAFVRNGDLPRRAR